MTNEDLSLVDESADKLVRDLIKEGEELIKNIKDNEAKTLLKKLERLKNK